jgi:hypothetical protein
MGGMGMGMGMNPMMMGGMGMGGMVSTRHLCRHIDLSMYPITFSRADQQGMGGGLGSGAYGVSHLSPWLQTLIPRSFWYG